MRAPRRAPGAGHVRAPGGSAVAPLACAALAALAVTGCGTARPAAGPPPPVLRVEVATGALVPQVATGVATGDGRVLTVAHVLAGARGVAAAGRRARVLRVDRGLDLALLAVAGIRAPPVRWSGGRDGALAVAVVRDRRARSLRGAVRRRVVVRWRDRPGDRPRLRPALELAAAVQPGDSGAPVLAPGGRLAGVVYARAQEDEGTAWAVDASAVQAFLAGAGPARAGD